MVRIFLALNLELTSHRSDREPYGPGRTRKKAVQIPSTIMKNGTGIYVVQKGKSWPNYHGSYDMVGLDGHIIMTTFRAFFLLTAM
jgi:hypothetical protein